MTYLEKAIFLTGLWLLIGYAVSYLRSYVEDKIKEVKRKDR